MRSLWRKISCSKCLFRQTAKNLHYYGNSGSRASIFVQENPGRFRIYGPKSLTTCSSLRSGSDPSQRACCTLTPRPSFLNRTLTSNPVFIQRRFSQEQPPKPDQQVHHFAVAERLHELEEKWRVRGYSLLRWGLGLVLASIASLYLFREELRENVADEVADVASRSLGDENVVNQVNEMTKLVLQDIVNDPETTRLASNFVMSVLNREDVRAAAVQLTLFVLKDPQTQAKVGELAAQTLKELVIKPEMRTILLGYVKGLILDESTKEVCKELLRGVIQDPVVKEFMSESLGNLVASSIVKNKAVELGKDVTHELVSDVTIQKETGDALWTVMKKTVTPSWFSHE